MLLVLLLLLVGLERSSGCVDPADLGADRCWAPKGILVLRLPKENKSPSWAGRRGARHKLIDVCRWVGVGEKWWWGTLTASPTACLPACPRPLGGAKESLYRDRLLNGLAVRRPQGTLAT